MLESILKLINGKEYYQLTKEEKVRLRNEEYKQILDSYIVISITFLVFTLIVAILIAQGTLDVPLKSVTFILIACVMVFLLIISVLMLVQKNSNIRSKIASYKFDLVINVVILFFLTFITLTNLDEGGYLLLYAVGLITFALLVRVKPHIVLFYFFIVIIAIFAYINLRAVKMDSFESFAINVFALNLIIFFASRIFFIEHIKRFLQQKKIFKQNAELENLANKDYLTNTYNRRGFANRIKEPIKLPAAVCMFDIDGLKFINDAFGHEKGDEAIIFAVKTIKQVFQDAFCARLGGDEFAIILEDTEEKKVNEMIARFSLVMESVNNMKLNISASIGYEMIKSDGKVMSALIKAEEIMYHKKLGARASRKERSLQTLMAAVYEYTDETEKHWQTLGHISQQILKKMGLVRKAELDAIKIACQLHDVGKLTLPRHLFGKGKSLTQEEMETYKRHSECSYKIACGIIEDKDVVNAILYHHESWDGTGYPYGIRGENIPVYARVIAVADTYDIMRSGRIFNFKKTHEEACAEIMKNKGTKFDPELVDIFVELPAEVLEL